MGPHGIGNAGIGLEFHVDFQAVLEDGRNKGPVLFVFRFLFDERRQGDELVDRQILLGNAGFHGIRQVVIEILEHHGYDVVGRRVIRDEIRVGEQEAFCREGHWAVALHVRQELVRRGSGLEEIGFADAAVGGDGFGNFPDRIAFGDDQPVRFGLAASELVQQRMEAHARIEGILAGMDIPGLASNGRYGAEP